MIYLLDKRKLFGVYYPVELHDVVYLSTTMRYFLGILPPYSLGGLFFNLVKHRNNSCFGES